MLNRSNWIPPVTAEEKTRLTNQLNVILYTLLAVSVVLLQLKNPLNRAVALLGFLTMLTSLFLVRRGYLTFPRLIIPINFWLLSTVFALNGEGLQDESVFGYFIVVAMSGLLLGQRTILIALGILILSVFGIYWAGENGLTLHSVDYNLSVPIVISTYILIGTVILRMIISYLNKSLQAARFNEQALAILNAELEERIQSRTQQLESSRHEAEKMYRLAAKVNVVTNYHDILQAIADEMGVLPYNIALSIYENYDLHKARFVTTYGILPVNQTEVIPMNVSNPIQRYEMDESGVYLVSDFNTAPQVPTESRQYFLNLGITAMMAANVQLGQREVGNISFFSAEARAFNEDEKRFILGMAQLAAAAIERSRLFKEAEAARLYAEKLLNAGRSINGVNSYVELTNAITHYFPDLAYDIALSAYENFDKRQAAHYYVLTAKTAGETEAQLLMSELPLFENFGIALDELYVETHLNEHLDDPRAAYLSSQGIASAMVVGLYAGNRYLGNLSITTREVHEFTPDDRQTLLGIADLAAAAIERIRLYNEQVKTSEELRQLDQMKSQFLASMSHELRTPLNAILNFTEFMSLGMLGPVTEKQTDALGKVLGSGRHLLALINDVLDITKIEAGMMQLFVEDKINLQPELNSVIAATETLLKNKSVRLITDIDTNLPTIVGDKRRIRQILLNLLSNAAKFTEEGSVTLSVKHQDDHLLFMVADTGPGIPPEDHVTIFEPFVQTETGIRHAGGTGLGLPITKRLVEAHGGKLWLESQLNQGTSFYVILPQRSESLLAMIKLPEVA